MNLCNGAAVNLINITGTTSGLGLIIDSQWVNHPVSSLVSFSHDVVASNFFFFSFIFSGKLELKSKISDKAGGVVLHFIPLSMLSVQI